MSIYVYLFLVWKVEDDVDDIYVDDDDKEGEMDRKSIFFSPTGQFQKRKNFKRYHDVNSFDKYIAVRCQAKKKKCDNRQLKIRFFTKE